MWQWMSTRYGGRGYFTDEEKAQHEGTAEFQDGYWRVVPPEEYARFRRWAGLLAYEQS